MTVPSFFDSAFLNIFLTFLCLSDLFFNLFYEFLFPTSRPYYVTLDPRP